MSLLKCTNVYMFGISDHEKYKVDIALSENEEFMCNEPDLTVTGNHIISQSNSRDMDVSRDSNNICH